MNDKGFLMVVVALSHKLDVGFFIMGGVVLESRYEPAVSQMIHQMYLLGCIQSRYFSLSTHLLYTS